MGQAINAFTMRPPLLFPILEHLLLMPRDDPARLGSGQALDRTLGKSLKSQALDRLPVVPLKLVLGNRG